MMQCSVISLNMGHGFYLSFFFEPHSQRLENVHIQLPHLAEYQKLNIIKYRSSIFRIQDFVTCLEKKGVVDMHPVVLPLFLQLGQTIKQ